MTLLSNLNSGDLSYGPCPICDAPGVTRCRCKLADTQCSNGHEWHFQGGQIVLGPADHSAGLESVGAARSSDWAGVFKVAAVCAAAVGTYFVYRHVVVGASTVRGFGNGARGRASS
jgi:hypothetical protein